MIVAITGDRNWTDPAPIRRALEGLPMGLVVLGDARGVDTLAAAACQELGLRFVKVVAEWERYGRGAGPIRNAAMLDYNPEVLWYFHENLELSKGTLNCVRQARVRGIPVLDGRFVSW